MTKWQGFHLYHKVCYGEDFDCVQSSVKLIFHCIINMSFNFILIKLIFSRFAVA